MRMVFPLFLSDSRRVPLSRRAISLVLTVIVHLLLLLMLLRLTPLLPPVPPEHKSQATFDVLPEKKASTPRAAKVEKAKRAASAAAPRAPKPPKPVETHATATMPPGFILMTSQQYAATDIGKIPKIAGAEGGGSSKGAGADTGVADAGGSGSELYDPEWFRRPTDAELAYYMPKGNRTSGWGMVACRTVANNRVEDCRELGQFPTGSGLARAVREAAWQFRVLPPRIDGRPVIGAWVRIRIDYTERGARPS